MSGEEVKYIEVFYLRKFPFIPLPTLPTVKRGEEEILLEE